ncbi:MAG: hypothetical protein LKI24_04060 [Acidipropionibacterium sp.]|jgi:hypothetical protein|nr:hypothetical protein [Acidipropionibacterium sp.]
MPYTSVLERASADTATRVVDLLVLWQRPDNRQIVPIGRFGFNGVEYTFSYTRAATELSGFRPLPGLGGLSDRYQSTMMPAVFSQRVMSDQRPDYSGYLHSLGLERATPWEQIVCSGGLRAGDTLQFMQVPVVSEGTATAQFLVNGISHIPDGPLHLDDRTVQATRPQLDGALAGLQKLQSVRLAREINNPEDPHAVLVMDGTVPLGWVPRVLSQGVRHLMASGLVSAVVENLGSVGASDHERLTLRIRAAAPEGFSFDPDGQWAPASTGK